MKTKVLLPLLAVSLIVLGAGCYGKSITTTTNTAATSGNAVSISNFAFSPANLTVKQGTTVTWTNNDSTGHTITGNNGGPASGTVQPGQTYSYTFSTIGTFNYHCSIHSYMTGIVTVTQ